MNDGNDFVWEKAPQFGWVQILFAFAIPSMIAYFGFHIVLPVIHSNGVAAIVAWPLVASVMLAGFVVVPVFMMKREATRLHISLHSRMCLTPISKRMWLFAIVVLIAGLAAASSLGKVSVGWIEFSGLRVPEYFPFFLNPSIDPMTADPATLSPDFQLQGAYWLIGLISLTLMLNILVETLYFRAWILPKMQKLGVASWVVNGLGFAFYHSFQLWLLPQILPISLLMALVVYKTKSIWPTLVIHLLVNSLTVVAMLMLIVL